MRCEEILRECDLHSANVVAVPDRFEDGVREPEDHEVLDSLFSEEVIDSIDPLLGEVAVDDVVEFGRGSGVTPFESP